MFFLHSYLPHAIAFILGPITIHWYGIVMAVAMGTAVAVAAYSAKQYGIKADLIVDLALWLIIGGLAGARLYEILLELPYYSTHLGEIIKVWNGGLAIHGAIIAGAIVLFIFCKQKKLDTWLLAALMVPALALGQAIGRWGNWFNQELFGRPTLHSWGIIIDELHRPLKYEAYTYFHPTFLYESIGCLGIFLVLMFMLKKRFSPLRIVGTYFILYGFLRFTLEFIKIDATPVLFGLRWPQIISLLLIAAGAYLFLKKNKFQKSGTLE